MPHGYGTLPLPAASRIESMSSATDPFDVFMIAYDEPDAAANFARLQTVRPAARLIAGVTGIRAAYRACADVAQTPFFFAVDGDNFMLDGFDFGLTFQPKPYETCIWHARNPVNGLVYAHGGIKLYSTEVLRRSSRGQSIDIVTSWAPVTRYLTQVASEHRYNSGPFTTWRTAFREAAKLVRDLEIGNGGPTLRHRLDTWCGAGADAPFGRWSIAGARDGRAFAAPLAKNQEALKRINAYDWLREDFVRRYGEAAADLGPGSGPVSDA
jgi:hypothetical protein